MTVHSLPEDLYTSDSKEKARHDIHFFRYHAQADTEKSRITLHHNVFSFVIDGFKSVSYMEKNITIDNTQFILLASGNCLMTQRAASKNGLFSSVLLFFDNALLADFFLKYSSLITHHHKAALAEQPAVAFPQDAFITNFAQSLQLMIDSGQDLSRERKRLKFEEIMLYLLDKYPDRILSLQSRQESPEDFAIRRMVEANLESNMTVEELAFLCNTSASTFKRRFSKIYGSSPNKWMLHKRMERAANLLTHHQEKPSDIYYKVGYESLSSFIESFKRVYGITPKEYQAQKLNAWP